MSDILPVCRSCAEAGLEIVLSLGKTPLANALLTEEQLEANERLASAYRDGSLNFGQWRITPDGRPPRLLYDAAEPQGK